MKIPSMKGLHPELSTRRIEALSDGVFAIVMTLLVLNFDIIQPAGQATLISLTKRLSDQGLTFLHFVESFIILAFFWIKHHQQFHFIKKSDQKLLWFNIFGLMFLCLIPFSATIMSDHGDQMVAAVFFETNMFIIGIIYYFKWKHATDGRRLVDSDLDGKIIHAYRWANLTVPVISTAAIALSLIRPRWGTFLYLLLPLMLVAEGHIFRRKRG